VPFQLGYRPKNIRKNQKAPTFVGAFENLNLNLECYGQTNPESRARLTRRLIMDLVFIVMFDANIARFQCVTVWRTTSLAGTKKPVTCVFISRNTR
jgi:hypothetical protein